MSWFGWWSRDERWSRPEMAILSNVEAITANTHMSVNQLFRKIDNLKGLIVATAEEIITAFNAATDEVAADLQTLKDELAAALASNDQEVQDAVDAALAGFDAPLARLQALGADVSNPVPPVEPTPEPAPPAEPA